MVQCEGHTKSGSRCKRNAEPNSVFCWQHSEESEMKYFDSHPEEKKVIPKIQPKTVNTIYKKNDLQGQTFQGGILNQILAYTEIAPEIGKIFNLSIKDKWSFILSRFKMLFPRFTNWNIANEHDINILYSLLKQRNTLNNTLVLQTLQKKVYYADFYDAYINTISLDQLADFLILIYSNKFFPEFKEFYPIFATRLNQMLLDKYGPKTEDYRFLNISNDIKSNYYVVVSLNNLENDIYLFLSPNPIHYRYIENNNYFKNTDWEYNFTGYGNIKAEAVEIYLSTHKTSVKVKKYIGDIHYNTSTPTWAYTVWKNFPNSEAKQSITHFDKRGKIIGFTEGSYQYSLFEANLDLTSPILANDVPFFSWLKNIFVENWNKYYSTNKNYSINKNYIDAFYRYVHDKVLELNPDLLPKLDKEYL